jgi:hypothetical protein
MTTDASPSVSSKPSAQGASGSSKPPSPGSKPASPAAGGAPSANVSTGAKESTRPMPSGSSTGAAGSGSVADAAAARAVANGGASRPSSPGLSSPSKPLVTNNPTSAAPQRPPNPTASARPSSPPPAPSTSPYTGGSSNASRPGTSSNGGAPTSWSDGAPSYGTPAAAQPAGSVMTDSGAPSGEPFTPRVARLTVASIDPFSALKLSFLLSVAAGIALVIAAIVLWLVLSGIGVFDQLNNVLGDLGMNTQTKKFDIYDYIGFGRIVSLSIVIGVINTLLLTALATVTAFLYNLSAGLVGGVRVTLSDD